MKIIFIDRNKSLVSKVKKAIKFLPKEWNVSAKFEDIFKEDGVIVSAKCGDFFKGDGVNVSAKFGSKKIHGKMMRMMFLKDKKYD